jgi:restriction system protein
MDIDDYVLTPEKATSTIHVSRCTGAYEYNPSVFSTDYPHVRRVEYLKTVPRSSFPQVVRNTLGSVLTVFRADIALPYVQTALGEGPVVGLLTEQVDTGIWADDTEAQARGQILEALDAIDHYHFQSFVAGLLFAMGYKTVVGGKGSDGGVDVLAYPDAFGLASPRIKIQVKNQKSLAGMPDVGYLNGVISSGEKGLFVCTGGFSKDAQAAPFVKSGQVALVDGSALLDLVLEHYERMPHIARQLLPLRRLYVPEKAPEA